jgi:acyl carrier protein
MKTTNNRHERLIHRLREIANDLSGIPVESLREDASFVELGFDSLFLTQLSAAYQKAFSVRITFRQLFDDLSTLSALSSYIDSKLPAEVSIAAPEPEAVTPAPAQSAPPAPAAATQAPKPAAVPQQPAPMRSTPAQTRVSPPRSAVPVLLPPRHADGLEAVLLQQLELMTEQLRLLQSHTSDGVAASYAPAPTETASIPELAVAPPPPLATPTVAKIEETSKGVADASSGTSSSAKESPVAKLLSGFGPGDVKNTGLHTLPLQQQLHLDALIENYTRKTAGSKQRTQRYRRALADPRTAAGFNRRWKEMVYPIWVQRSLGSKLWDVDGNEYIDLLNGFGPIFLGHAPEYITKAIEDQLHRGFEIGPQTPLEIGRAHV